MKRITWIFAALLILLGSVPITASAKANTVKSWKILYSEYIKKVLTDNKNYYDSSYYFTLVDLNLDGTPELIQGFSMGLASSITSAVAVQNGKVVPFIYQKKLSTSSEGIFNVGMGGFLAPDNLQLYKSKKDGAYRYIAFVTRQSSVENSTQVFEVSLQGTKFNDKEIFQANLIDQEKTDNSDLFYVNQKEEKKSAYDKAYKQYFSNLTKVPIKIITVTSPDLFNDKKQIFVPNGITNFLNSYSSAKAK
ncbi:hypothetical protein NYE33_33650 [Paenibacillus sp. FSL R10-2199]|uniref:hypothetical protein n=1 Tax=Paenibacillus sp. FSL R10-2199 TaxID=2975348 RepID=UPI0030F5A42E